jgi:HNH endonuclease
MKRVNGRFRPTPDGVKTPRMLQVEARLGKTLEEDFEEYYVKQQWGQKRLAARWGVKRSTIFSTSMRGGRRSWSQMLRLNVRRPDGELPTAPAVSSQCEACGVSDVGLDDAHWVSNSNGGSSATHNIIKLCPNCHRQLDRGDSAKISACRELLLFREVKRIIENGKDTAAKKRKLLEVSEAILLRKPL